MTPRKPFNEEDTILTPKEHRRQPTGQYVRNLLGDPDNIDRPLSELSWEQRMSLAQVRLAEDMQDLRANGCHKHCDTEERIDALEGFRGNIKAVGWALGVAGAVVGFIFMVIQFIKSV